MKVIKCRVKQFAVTGNPLWDADLAPEVIGVKALSGLMYEGNTSIGLTLDLLRPLNLTQVSRLKLKIELEIP